MHTIIIIIIIIIIMMFIDEQRQGSLQSSRNKLITRMQEKGRIIAPII